MINLYIDLDDTLFQTKYKNPSAKIRATIQAPGRIDSYMSVAQQRWLNLWLERKDTRLIPITARSLSQYQRTHLSQDPRIELAATYFSGQILYKGKVLPDWQTRWQAKMQHLPVVLTEAYALVDTVIASHQSHRKHFRLFDVDGFYISVKAHRRCPPEEREACFKALRDLKLKGYVCHENARAFAWLPDFLNKKQAVSYLKQTYAADLHLGMGDSHSDWDFMQLCDFQIMPKQSQLHQILSEQL